MSFGILCTFAKDAVRWVRDMLQPHLFIAYEFRLAHAADCVFTAGVPSMSLPIMRARVPSMSAAAGHDADDFGEQSSQVPDKEFAQFLNEASLGVTLPKLVDSECDSDEYQDEVGGLPVLAPVAGLDLPLSIVFLVDVSRSMEREDILELAGEDGSSCRRIDAVVKALKHFMEHQRSSGASSDKYTLATVRNSEMEVVFRGERCADAITALEGAQFQPWGHMRYESVAQAIRELCAIGQRSRVIFLSDGCTAPLPRTTLPNFQEVVRADVNLM
eukprot:1943263-Amphidinium_carterae.1